MSEVTVDRVHRDSSNIILPDKKPQGDVINIDGLAIVNTKPPQNSKTFGDYAREDILPKVNA